MLSQCLLEHFTAKIWTNSVWVQKFFQVDDADFDQFEGRGIEDDAVVG